MEMFEDKNPKRTPISELGEFGLIDHLVKAFPLKNSSSILGPGDDAAVIDFNGKSTVVTTDMLVEGIHFNLSYVPLKHLGYKSVIVNLSDLYAMNALPQQITVSLALSNRFPIEAVEEIYAGIQLACEKYGVDLIGGDTTSSTSGLVISITAIGSANQDEIVKRSGAKANDLIVVSGDIGGAYIGLQVLEREQAVFEANPNTQPDLAAYPYVLERQLKPEARKDVRGILEGLDIKPSSMIDISDGLSSEMIHISKASNLGCKIFEDKLPLDPEVIRVCEEFNVDHTTMAINGGEDYELLFTVPLEAHDKIKDNPSLTLIGHMTESDGMFLVTRDGAEVPLTAKGWDPFLNKDAD